MNLKWTFGLLSCCFLRSEKRINRERWPRRPKTPNKGRGSRGEKEEETISKDEGEKPILFLKAISKKKKRQGRQREREREGVEVD